LQCIISNRMTLKSEHFKITGKLRRTQCVCMYKLYSVYCFCANSHHTLTALYKFGLFKGIRKLPSCYPTNLGILTEGFGLLGSPSIPGTSRRFLVVVRQKPFRRPNSLNLGCLLNFHQHFERDLIAKKFHCSTIN